jgi:hypothetical protein
MAMMMAKMMVPRLLVIARTTARSNGGQPMVMVTRSRRRRNSVAMAPAASIASAMMPTWIGSQMVSARASRALTASPRSPRAWLKASIAAK